MINPFRKQTETAPTDTLTAPPSGGLPAMLMKGGMAIGGFGLLMTLLNFGGSLFSNAPTTGQQTVVALPEASPVAEPAAASSSTQTRDEAWNKLQASVSQLTLTANDLDSNLRLARAQRWLLFASTRCQELGAGGCSSPRALLLDFYLGSAAQLQQKIRAGQIPVDSGSVKQWREKISDLQDMAQALSLDITGSQPVPFVVTADISAAMDDVYTTASQFDSIRQQQQLEAFQGTAPTPSPTPVQEEKQ